MERDLNSKFERIKVNSANRFSRRLLAQEWAIVIYDFNRRDSTGELRCYRISQINWDAIQRARQSTRYRVTRKRRVGDTLPDVSINTDYKSFLFARCDLHALHRVHRDTLCWLCAR